jgi:phospholipase C
MATAASPIKTVVIIIKENHGYDNYFGTFPGGNGDATLPQAPNPPTSDPNHTHEAWLRRRTGATKPTSQRTLPTRGSSRSATTISPPWPARRRPIT